MPTDKTTKLLDKAQSHERRAARKRRVARDAAMSGRTFDARLHLCAADTSTREAERLREQADEADNGYEVDFGVHMRWPLRAGDEPTLLDDIEAAGRWRV